jgi:tetratricopeptide (TPR) repeat protein
LQLAEEYRQLDRWEEAVEVLSKSLEDNPEHVAARVALGRFRLELGEIEEACTLLEQVVGEDPTHLVASKLLVNLYLERGDERQARDRLDLYKILNPSDPEIESLEAQLSGGSAAPESAVVIVDIPRNGDPFADLWAPGDSEAYWNALGAEGIFPVSGRPSPVQAPGATVTLANLYLQQGHLEDAEKAFREGLDRQPANRGALAGLAEIRQQRQEISEDVAASAVTAAPEAVEATSRKIEILQDYLRRIRGAGNQQ